MITIDNAISRFASMAEHFDKRVCDINSHHGWISEAYLGYCTESAAEYRQIVEWLKELKKLKEKENEGNSASRVEGNFE